jgi:hypothetical protein
MANIKVGLVLINNNVVFIPALPKITEDQLWSPPALDFAADLGPTTQVYDLFIPWGEPLPLERKKRWRDVLRGWARKVKKGTVVLVC